ncbi:MAG: hypothetical protein ACYS8L_08165 [Planctomycetota bacterium]|jgi:hypothetical protein
MRSNQAYQRFQDHADGRGWDEKDLDPLTLQDVEAIMFPEGRPANDGTRHDAALRCYRGVLAERKRQVQVASLMQRLRDAGLPVQYVHLTDAGFITSYNPPDFDPADFGAGSTSAPMQEVS